MLEQLTEEEKQLLAPYVTNLDGSVFMLTNLPEVVKGALFSRYSRSSLGLRRLLLKEFLQDPESEMTAISGGGGVERAETAQKGVERAQNFYDRILDGYGDDSIGELGGGHLALEDVSMIATKILEDARIGGSPLEKSTRYVSFGEKHNGDYLFYKEPRLMASDHRERYLAHCRELFDTYRDMVPPMVESLQGRVPREEAISEAAYQRAVKARAFDALRGLLPASTLTNMGIFGNGRFFESLLVRLRLSGLAETEALGETMFQELSKVIPSFVRRGEKSHRHLAGFAGFDQARRALLGEIGQTAPGADYPPPDGPRVNLVDWDPDGETKVLAALLYPDSALDLTALRQWAKGVDDAQKDRWFSQMGDMRANRRHKPGRETETVRYTFDLLGDFGMYRDLQRHRTLTQWRQPLSTRWGYAMADEVAEAGLDGRYREVMAKSAEVYEAIRADFPLEAQYGVPMAYRIRWSVQINLRALIWLVELRSQPQGHPAYRWIAQQMAQKVAQVHPRLGGLMRFVDMGAYPLGRLGQEQKLEEKRQNKPEKK
ncbi:MAG: FAD-dependent thymidylate synthase [Deltaproteobacteria bacterium]|nr:FAD-dependent thymidylate synthase [Deltaproteobacteria bacterium]